MLTQHECFFVSIIKTGSFHVPLNDDTGLSNILKYVMAIIRACTASETHANYYFSLNPMRDAADMEINECAGR